MAKGKKISLISRLHYFKLVFRSLLFLAALAVYIARRVLGKPVDLDIITERPVILGVVLVVFVVEMLLRFFPSRLESMGCQKQFARNFIPTEVERPTQSTRRSTLAVALVWLLLNGLIGAAHPPSDLPFRLGVRYDLHSVLLPLPDLDDEEQVLRLLPYL